MLKLFKQNVAISSKDYYPNNNLTGCSLLNVKYKKEKLFRMVYISMGEFFDYITFYDFRVGYYIAVSDYLSEEILISALVG